MEHDNNQDAAAPAPHAPAKAIVSVNSRGGSSSNAVAKIFFVVAVFALILIAALVIMNKWRANNKAEQEVVEKAAKAENKSGAVGQRRTFDTDPPPLPGTAKLDAPADAACSDGMVGTIMLGPDGKPMMSPAGIPMRVCKDGKVVVPAVQNGAATQPIGVAGQPKPQQAGGTPPPSRYAGDIVVVSANSFAGGAGANQGRQTPADAANDAKAQRQQTAMSMVQDILKQQGQGGTGAAGAGRPGGTAGTGAAGANPQGSLGSLLTPSSTPMVQAGMLGDRNMILPKGRTIDCVMSMRLVNEVAGMASCVLTQNVYSDNGRVVLLERGAEATGEYVAAMAQGQRRLFVLWTRIKSPEGVVINLNSPAADALGTSGMDGYVDNHWWERIGAAFMLSMVKDAVAYAAAPSGSGAVYQNSSQTSEGMATKVLESTINIKPTLYKNQGDRGSIYVARDLDFGTVYALKPR